MLAINSGVADMSNGYVSIELLREPMRGHSFYHLGSKYDITSVSRGGRIGAKRSYTFYAVCGGFGQYFEAVV